MTMNGNGSFSVCPSTVTCSSCIDSSRALWTFGGARFISSARRMLVNIGPRLNSNSLSFMLKTNPPTMSSGRMSGVNWTRLNCRPRHFENAFASRVFETPGTPSSRTCPLARRHMRRRSTSFSRPTTSFPTSATTLSLISAPKARASTLPGYPSEHVRDLDDLAEVEVWEGRAAVSILFVAPQRRTHPFGLDA